MAFSNFIFETSVESGRKDWQQAKFSNAEKHYDRALKEALQPGAYIANTYIRFAGARLSSKRVRRGGVTFFRTRIFW